MRCVVNRSVLRAVGCSALIGVVAALAVAAEPPQPDKTKFDKTKVDQGSPVVKPKTKPTTKPGEDAPQPDKSKFTKGPPVVKQPVKQPTENTANPVKPKVDKNAPTATRPARDPSALIAAIDAEWSRKL